MEAVMQNEKFLIVVFRMVLFHFAIAALFVSFVVEIVRVNRAEILQYIISFFGKTKRTICHGRRIL